MSPHWTALVQTCSESSINEAYDLATSWIEETDMYPRDGPSHEGFSSGLQSDTPVLAPTSVPVATPEGLHPSGSEEDVTESMASKEGGDVVTGKIVTWNIPSEEGPVTSASEGDIVIPPEPYIMKELLNLDAMYLRRSSRTSKPSELVLKNKI